MINKYQSTDRFELGWVTPYLIQLSNTFTVTPLLDSRLVNTNLSEVLISTLPAQVLMGCPGSPFVFHSGHLHSSLTTTLDFRRYLYWHWHLQVHPLNTEMLLPDKWWASSYRLTTFLTFTLEHYGCVPEHRQPCRHENMCSFWRLIFNRLTVNYSKHNFMVFGSRTDLRKSVISHSITANGYTFQHVDEFTYLGLKFDPELSFLPEFNRVICTVVTGLLLSQRPCTVRTQA